MVHHDGGDARSRSGLSKGVPAAEHTRGRLPGLTLLSWAGPEGPIASLVGGLCDPPESVELAGVPAHDLLRAAPGPGPRASRG